MKVTGSLKRIMTLGLTFGLSLGMVSCFSSDQQAGEEGLENTEQGGNEYANQEGGGNEYADQEGGNEYANQEGGGNEYANQEGGGNDYGGNEYASEGNATDTEMVNNATDDAYANTSTDAYANTAATDSYANTAAPANEYPVANAAPMENAAPMNAAPVESAPVAAAPSGDRVVRFITANDTVVFSQPDSTSAAVATLEQGSAVVVSVSGSWAMIGDGRYVSASSLSEQAVPRSKSSNPWN